MTIDKNRVVLLLAEVKAMLDVKDMKIAFSNLRKTWTWNPFSGTKGDVSKAWEQFLFQIDKLTELVTMVVVAVEKVKVAVFGDESGTGGMKLEAAVEFLDEVCITPWYLTLFKRPLFRLLISLAVSTLNRYLGKNWLSKL